MLLGCTFERAPVHDVLAVLLVRVAHDCTEALALDIIGVERVDCLRHAIWNLKGLLGTLTHVISSSALSRWLIERYDYRVNFQAMSWGFVGATLVWGALLRRAPEPGAG